MRVMIVSQYFPPEIHGPSARLGSFSAGLTKRGHEVEVICEVPSHPAGVVAPGYGGKLVDRRFLDGAEVRYVWVRATPSKATRARLANYASFAASATLVGSVGRRPDVILASSPPLPVGSAAAALAFRHRVPWVFDVRDLWPDAAVAVGEVSEGRLYRVAARVERRLYRSAAAITAATDSFKREIERRGGKGKVTVVRNGTSAVFLDAGLAEPDRSLLGGGDDRFTWAYAGNLGLAQGLESAVEAAGALGEGFRLLLIGDGPRRAELREQADQLPNGQVEFVDPVPPKQAGRLLRAADALLVSLADGFEGFVPSKLYDCCAVGRPVILAVAGEAATLADDAGAALCVPPADPDALAAAVRRLRDEPKLGERLAASGRFFAEANSREAGVDRLEEVLAGVAR
jgi:glycosyltransferase involved in cell wall biosynthesis